MCTEKQNFFSGILTAEKCKGKTKSKKSFCRIIANVKDYKQLFHYAEETMEYDSLNHFPGINVENTVFEEFGIRDFNFFLLIILGFK